MTMVTLSDVTKIVTKGTTPTTLGMAFQDGGIPFIRVNNIQNKVLNFTDDVLYIDGQTHEKLSRSIIKPKDVLISIAGSIGRSCVVPDNAPDLNCNQAVCIIRCNIEKILPEYLSYWLGSEIARSQISNSKVTGVIQNLSLTQVKALKIDLPPLAEQCRIASILDKAYELRQKRQQAIKKLDQLLQATFIDMFGDPKTNPYNFDIRKLSEFYINSKNGTKCGPFGSALKRHEYVENGIPVWSMDVITLGGAFIDKPSLWVTSEKFKELESYSVEQGDVIISRAGTVGKMGVVHSQHEKSLISTNLIRVRFGKMLLPEYFVALMTYCKHRLSRLQTGADGAFTHMSTGILDNLEFPYPPIEKQKQFVDFLHMVNNNKEILLKSDKRINELFSAVQNQAFSGTL
ncbi:restriction endonuclease subunit S [Acinetobacter baumannii]|uniref:restriction endonuclease subunit S n=1 Tax=Acinetobacter baumannii TaxID=470 RepID=UPI0037BE25E4